MKRVLLSFTTALLSTSLVVGCGPSTCERLAVASEQLQEKSKLCLAPNTEEFDMQQCEEVSKSCSWADRDGLHRFADCVDRLGTCDPDQLEAWVNDYFDCVNEVHVPSSCGT